MATLGPTEFALVRQNLEQVRLGCQFLVCGFDEDRHPQILTIDDPGVVSDHFVAGSAAIGSGTYQALSSLALRGNSRGLSTPTVIYNACEAKFAAESAIGVGEETLAFLFRKDRSTTVLGQDVIKRIRTEWNEIGKPRPLGAKTEQANAEAIRLLPVWF